MDRRLREMENNVAELRRRELEALDPINRPIQERIWDLEEATEAMNALLPEGG